MPDCYRRPFVDGRRAQLVDLAGAIGVPQRSQKWCNILLKEKFFLFAINENLGWLYVLAIKTRSSPHFSSPLKTGPDISRGHHLGEGKCSLGSRGAETRREGESLAE